MKLIKWQETKIRGKNRNIGIKKTGSGELLFLSS